MILSKYCQFQEVTHQYRHHHHYHLKQRWEIIFWKNCGPLHRQSNYNTFAEIKNLHQKYKNVEYVIHASSQTPPCGEVK